ncbi:MAG: PA2817 family protein [Halioglobus sp.]
MKDDQYLAYCHALMSSFSADLEKRTEKLDAEDSLRQLALAFTALSASPGQIHSQGLDLVTRLFTTYPDFAPSFPRDLLWFLGGDCLHYMPDEEIQQHQQLDEMRHEAAARGATLDLAQARANLLKLQ